MRQELQDPTMLAILIRLLGNLLGRAAVLGARLRVHPQVQQDAKDGDIAHLRGHVDGIHALQANFSWAESREEVQR